jgi:PAS domain S-box-containing protein
MKEKSRVSQYLRFLSRSYKEQFNVPQGQDLINTSTAATATDINEAERREKRRHLMLEIFAVLTGVEDQDEILTRILHLFKDYSVCDAAGIRLQKGDDYPYVQTIGFDEKFVKAETMLCCEGSTATDKGPVALECMCGRVIRGELEPSLGAVTDSGAFYCGNINELAAKLAKKNLPFKIRNHCGSVGYNSIALIPLRFREQTVGLLQLNANKADLFNDDEIEFLIVAGQSIGAALVRFQAEQARRKSDKILEAIIQRARDGFSLSQPDGTVLIYNQAMESMTGYTQDEVNRHGWFYLTFPDAEERRKAIHQVRLAMSGKIDYLETQITRKDGNRKWVALSLTPLEIDDKTYNFFTMIDISSKYRKND